MSAEIELTVFEVADDIWERAHRVGNQAVNQIGNGAQWIGGALKGEFKPSQRWAKLSSTQWSACFL
ncbi:hypothetical protein RGU75_02620 [Glaciimonas sp. CA11.2]|uniref:hypothetical protein n=1 Tax=Glaciimonas sp. CA11.2 TaxID=3048601 RepID=UPI002AB496A6|nr:hypothetical protein [Glaciimonas sp. CA11.2]MDY7545128.1 hypothetical protein [Glaciimonas sp. CA11.2]